MSNELNMPSQAYVPMSSTTAGILGTAVGGALVGAAAASEAVIKKKQYDIKNQEYMKAKFGTDNARDNLGKCYDEIVCLLYLGPAKVADDWRDTQNKVDVEFSSKYVRA